MNRSKFKGLFIVIFAMVFLSFTTNDSSKYYQLVQTAQKEHKQIAVYFSGSDWCTKCVSFKKKYLENGIIQALLSGSYIYYIADFPQRKKIAKDEIAVNEALAEKLNPDGVFPLLVITDTDMNILGTVSNGTQLEDAISILEKSTAQ